MTRSPTAGRPCTRSGREADHLWAVYARRLVGVKHTVGHHWHEAFGQTEAIALRALAQQFRAGKT